MEDMEVIEAPKVKGKPGRKPKAETSVDMASLLQTVMEQNRLLIEQMGKQNAESTLSLAAELRKPTDMEQKKLDDERLSLQKRALMAVQAAKQKDAQDNAKRAVCPHKDRNGITCFNGQVTSDGRWAVFCNRCGLPAPRIKATQEERMSGINIRSWENLTFEGLERLHKQREGMTL